jgi:hypothetical protein
VDKAPCRTTWSSDASRHSKSGNGAASTYKDRACAVREVALPAILEAVAAAARLQIPRSLNIEPRTKDLGIRREPLCTKYAEEAADGSLPHS